MGVNFGEMPLYAYMVCILFGLIQLRYIVHPCKLIIKAMKCRSYTIAT